MRADNPVVRRASRRPSADFYRACVDAPFEYAAWAPHLITRAEYNERLEEGSRRADISCAGVGGEARPAAGPHAGGAPGVVAGHPLVRRGWGLLRYGHAIRRGVAGQQRGRPADPVHLYGCERQGGVPCAAAALLEADPRHPRHGSGLRSLYWKVWHSGAEVDAETLLRHWNTDYEIFAQSPGEKISAAALVYATAVEAGDQEAAEEIRVRVRGDLGLDTLEFKRREATLELVCDRAILELDLEELCTGGVERLAAESAALGDPLPPDVLRPLEGAIRLISGTRLRLEGGGGPQERDGLERLRTVLGGYPEHLKSSEHFRVFAEPS